MLPIVIGPILVSKVGIVRDRVAEPRLALNPLHHYPINSYRLQQAYIRSLWVSHRPHMFFCIEWDICFPQLFLQHPLILQAYISTKHTHTQTLLQK